MMREMPGMEWILDIGLVILLAVTLFHAIRLERALGVLKRDRAALEALVQTFNASTRAAETGVERLRATTDGAGRQIQRQIDTASRLKDDLTFLVQRGEGLADRLDEAVRAARPMAALYDPAPHPRLPDPAPHPRLPDPAPYPRLSETAPGPWLSETAPGPWLSDTVPRPWPSDTVPRPRPLDGSSRANPAMAPVPTPALAHARAGEPEVRVGIHDEPRVRSQAERDLLKALRMAR